MYRYLRNQARLGPAFLRSGEHGRAGHIGENPRGPLQMNRMLGVWCSGTESDVVPAGGDAIGYKAGTVVRPMIEKAALQYAKENNIKLRDCPKTEG